MTRKTQAFDFHVEFDCRAWPGIDDAGNPKLLNDAPAVEELCFQCRTMQWIERK